jgi:hypothetical protein
MEAGQRIAAAYEALAHEAKELNTASDRLGVSVGRLDDALRILNLGVITWVPFGGWENQDEFERREIGYSKVGSTWGIALAVTRGQRGYEEDARKEKWLFNDAPRVLRVEGIEALTELVEAMARETKATTQRIKDKTDYARQLADTVAGVARQKK